MFEHKATLWCTWRSCTREAARLKWWWCGELHLVAEVSRTWWTSHSRYKQIMERRFEDIL